MRDMPMALRVVGVIVALGLLFSSPAQAKMSFIPLPMQGPGQLFHLYPDHPGSKKTATQPG